MKPFSQSESKLIIILWVVFNFFTSKDSNATASIFANPESNRGISKENHKSLHFTNVNSTLFTFGSTWTYLDNGTNQGVNWYSTTFSDANWKSGPSPLGYGNNPATKLNFGGNSSNKYITYYFRKQVNFTSPRSYASITMNLHRDDGIVVYVNGKEVFRNNISTGTVTYTTLASSASDNGNGTIATTIPISAFIAGTNTISAELHQCSKSDPDLKFDMEMIANGINEMPSANAGIDQIITLPTTSTNLNGTGTDPDGSIASFNWTQISGPLACTFSNSSIAVTSVSGMTKTGIYAFKLSVTDNLGLTAFDTINITCNALNVLNQAPISNAGIDQSINLPISSANLSGSGVDADGTISSYNWTQINGPVTALITYSNSALTTVTGMTLPGIYSYKFTVTDNLGSSTYDTINITVYTLIRGPYLQKVNSTSLLLRWRTDIATSSQVEVGTVYGTYEKVFSDTKYTSDHVVLINGLLPDTKYYYRFGNTNNIIQSGNDNYFITAPNSLSTRKMRFAAFGDCGRNDNGFQSNTLSAYLNYTGNDKAEVLLLLGDNAYDNGLDSEYQTKMFNVYSSNILKNHALFPAPGNHDYANTVARQVDKKIPYYDIFSTPANAECGGVASLTSSYYSFNWGNVHFLSLDSYGFETTNQLRIYDTMSPQIVWLKNDLEANLSKWTVVYFHHPPYTMGSHNSDTEAELISIRQAEFNR